jgi:hypothetical protein
VPGAADALQSAGDRGWRLDLDDEVDRAHVDPSSSDEVATRRRRWPPLRKVFDSRCAARAPAIRDARAPALAGDLVERAGQPLRQPRLLTNSKRRSMRAISSTSRG